MASPKGRNGRGIYASAYSGLQSSNAMSGLFGAGQSSAAASATQGDISKDVQVQNPPEDSISDLSFSPTSDHLAVASWDKKVRIYEIDGQGNSAGKALFDHEGPVLSCTWSKVSSNKPHKRAHIVPALSSVHAY